MRLLILGLAVPAICGCEALTHTTVAPKALVEGCIVEAYPASHEGWGPNCTSLNEWMKLHQWIYAGGPMKPVPLSDAERAQLVTK